MGTLFQVVDDILDVEGCTEQLGKRAGSDETLHKATYPSICGLNGSKKIAVELENEVHKLLAKWGQKAETLSAVSGFILERQN